MLTTMKPHPFILLAIILLAALEACETVVDIDLPPEPTRLVVNSFITPDYDVSVRVSKSKSVLDSSPSGSFTYVEGAQITLFEDGTDVARLAPEDEYGGYTTSFRPRAGHRYAVQVVAEGLEAVEASSDIVPAVAIRELTADSIFTESGYNCVDDDCSPYYSKDYRFQLRLTDPGDRDDFYEIVGYTTVLDSFPTAETENGETIFEKTTYQYPIDFTTDDPAVENPEFSVDGDSFYGSSLLFTDEIFAGRSYTINFTTNHSYGSDLTKVVIELRTLSRDRYEYLRSRHLQDYHAGNPFSEVVPVYTNIENGFGIFAGYSTDSVVVVLE